MTVEPPATEDARGSCVTPRLATDGDLSAVVGLVNAAYRGISVSRESWTSEADLLDGPRIDEARLRAELIEKPEARLLVMVDDNGDDLIGCVLLESAGEAAWYLGMLSIHPEAQGGQVGRRLLAAAEALAVAEGARSVRMTVISGRTSLTDWYLRRGYALTGETLPFPYDDTSVGRPRRDDLYFVVLEKRLSR